MKKLFNAVKIILMALSIRYVAKTLYKEFSTQ